ncbi:MAG: 2OG-Fe(II) oxygenase [Burkholderiales bacterium]|nr:2OG-Fe(II) oxygenase [Burkholderiales bacterium]
MASYFNILAGDPAPWFVQRTRANANFAFDVAAGRYIVLCFFASAADPQGRAAVDAALARPDIFNDNGCTFFGVSVDPADESSGRIADSYPGYRFFWDFDARVSRLYGALPYETAPGEAPAVRRMWFVLDPTLRVMKTVEFTSGGDEVAGLMAYLAGLPPRSHFAGFELQAPVLVLPNVFTPETCRELVTLYDADGGHESGFMREVNGKTVALQDPGFKRRKDFYITDDTHIARTRAMIVRRVGSEIAKVHQYHATHMERYLVACYRAEDDAHFSPHRDNTNKGTEHRRFAVSINLNEDFDGGEVSFPEYGPRGYKLAPGVALVFSCSLLHAVSRVTRGSRYAFLPFLYDDAAARLREANNAHLGEGVPKYEGG